MHDNAAQAAAAQLLRVIPDSRPSLVTSGEVRATLPDGTRVRLLAHLTVTALAPLADGHRDVAMEALREYRAIMGWHNG